MAKVSKRYRAAEELVPEMEVAPIEAMKIVKEMATANFDETVTVDFRLGIDTRQADQQLRGTVSLPNGSGKTVRVAVFAEGEAAKAAQARISLAPMSSPSRSMPASSILMPLSLPLTRWARLDVSVRCSAPVVLCLTRSLAP